MVNSLVIFVIFVLNFVYTQQADLPLLSNPCPRNAGNLAECLKSGLTQSWPQIVAGVPEFNIPPLDPLKIDRISDSFDLGAFRGKYSVFNAETRGLSKTKLLSVNPKFANDRLHLDMKFNVPKIIEEADYDVDGSGNQLTVKGKGHATIDLTDVTMTVAADGPIVNDRWSIDAINVTPRIGGMKFRATDLFNGNQLITEGINAYINENWRQILESGSPMVDEFINSWVKDFLNKIFTQIPISKVFPQ